MKKFMTYMFAFSILVSGCGTHAAQGAYTGSQVGSILGSAIGGMSDGWRGRDVGTVVGLVGGAVVGGAIGNACDKAEKKNIEKSHDRYRDDDAYDDGYRNYDTYAYNDGFDDPYHAGNDSRRYINRHNENNPSVRYTTLAELCNIMFYDYNDDGILTSREDAEIEFEIRNTTHSTIHDIVPVVEEISGAKHIHISPSVVISSIGTGKKMRYTAYIKTGKLKNGHARFRISLYNGSEQLITPRTEFEVETNR